MTAIERAFALAKTGHYRTTSEIKTRLRHEGYFAEVISGSSLLKQLNAFIREAKKPTGR
jgi:hypothetical protein